MYDLRKPDDVLCTVNSGYGIRSSLIHFAFIEVAPLRLFKT